MNIKYLGINVVQLDGSEAVLTLTYSGFCVGVFIIPIDIQFFHIALSYDL